MIAHDETDARIRSKSTPETIGLEPRM